MLTKILEPIVPNSSADGKLKVGDIMTTDVIAVTPDTNLVVVLDIMLKKHIRRIPVVEGEKMAGIVYISDLFYYILDRLTG